MALFSRIATLRLLANLERPSTYVSVPCTEVVGALLTWMLSISEALCLLAKSALACNPTNTSVSRVKSTRTSGWEALIFFPTSFATARVISFSLPPLPTVPGSLPPCPASITTEKRRCAWRSIGITNAIPNKRRKVRKIRYRDRKETYIDSGLLSLNECETHRASYLVILATSIPSKM